MENDRQALHLQPVPVLGGPCDLIEVLSVRKFVTQLVRRLPKNFADAVPEAAKNLRKRNAKKRNVHTSKLARKTLGKNFTTGKER